MSKYVISKEEMKRRKQAFITLIISTILGLIIASFQYISDYTDLYCLLLLAIIVIFYLFGRLLFDFINNFSKIKITLDDKCLKRTTDQSEESYDLKDITKIIVRYNAGDEIREIKINLKNNHAIYFNGLEHAKKFIDELSSNVNKNTIIIHSHEPINVNHQKFYVIVGLLLGYISFDSLNFVNVVSTNITNILYYSLLLFILVMGIFFIMYKPISKRSSIKNEKSDLIAGILITIAAVSIFIINII